MASKSPIQHVAPRARATRRRLPGPERRALIFDAAMRAFAANGYDGAAMDEIAAAAGISKAVVYDHVASKRDLYTQLLHEIRTDIEALIDEALRVPAADGEERVRLVVDSIYRYVNEHPEASRLLVLELQGANVSAIGRDLEERVSADLARTLGNETSAFAGDPDRETHLLVLAELLKSVVLGGAGWWYRNARVPREHLVERTVGVLWPAIERALAT